MNLRPHSWYAIQTRPKAEMLVATLLQHKGYEIFLPLHRAADSVPLAAGRQRNTPLFPGYLFCKHTEAAAGMIVTTPGVLRLVGSCGTPAPVPVDEIRSIQQAVASGLPLRPSPQLQPGELIEVAAGPLKGCKGVLVTCKSELHLIVSIALLQRSVAVEVQRSWVLPARKGQAQERAYAHSAHGAA
jgi:transcriptional antiterminator RfaH